MAGRGGIAVKREAEKSFVLNRGEGLNSRELIKHTVLHVETPRASNADSSSKAAGAKGKPGFKYASTMQRARHDKKRREAGESIGASKDWPSLSDIETSSNPSSESAFSGVSNNETPARQAIIPSSGYIAKPRGSVSTSNGEELSGSGRLPKFGVWDNHNESSGPCYTLLFENVAQEKRIGGLIRVHAPKPCSPARNEDLYSYNHGASIKARKNRQSYSLLSCCFAGS